MSDESKYKAYVTRLSKHLAFSLAHENTVSEVVVRAAVLRRGELESALDATWAKRVFGDRDLFESRGNGFWTLRWDTLDNDDGPPIPSPWEGVRPGEDVLGDAYAWLFDELADIPKPRWKSRRLMDESWDPIHPRVVKAMDRVRSRGIAKPLVPFQEYAFDAIYGETPRPTSDVAQTIALWLGNTRFFIEALTRVRAYGRNEGTLTWSWELELYAPHVATEAEIDFPPSPSTAVAVLKEILTKRGVLTGKSS